MTFHLRRATPEADGLALSRAHSVITAPRRGTIHWEAFDRAAYKPEALRAAASAWRERARQEYASLALFTQLSSQLHLLGAPLDCAGALARMIGDEVRHTEICARFADLLEPGVAIEVDESALHLPAAGASLDDHVRGVVLAAFCVGETLSGRFFRRSLRAATVPLARDVVRTIVDDETFHGAAGWELFALLLRGDRGAEARRSLGATIPELLSHYRTLSGAQQGEAWALTGPEAPADPNFGVLTPNGYARAFFRGLREDVVPTLAALGLADPSELLAAVEAAPSAPTGEGGFSAVSQP